MMAALNISPIIIGIVLGIIYLSLWIAPSLLPSFTQKFYKDVWYPVSPGMRILMRIVLALGASGGDISWIEPYKDIRCG